MAAFTPIRPTSAVPPSPSEAFNAAADAAAVASVRGAISVVQAAQAVQAQRTGAQAITPTEAKAPATAPANMDAVYAAIVDGNLVGLKPQERLAYYNRLCEGLGLNPLTKPFGFYQMKADGKTVVHVYALKECAAQLARRDDVSVEIVKTEWIKEMAIYEVWARASSTNNRGEKRVTDEIGVVALADGAKADAAGVQRMKAVTKARRRCILAHCGLGLLDETEIESVQGAKVVSTDAFLSGEEDKRTPPPAQTPGAASVRIPDELKQQAERPPVVESEVQEAEQVKMREQVVEDLGKAQWIVDANSFDASKPADMDWLMKTLKATFPSSMRAVLVQLAETLKGYKMRSVIMEQIEKHKAMVSV